MLQRIVFNISKQVLERNYGKLISGNAKSRFNINSGSKLIIKSQNEDFLIWSKWGMVPYETSDLKEMESLDKLDISDSDKINELGLRKSSRCIIPASGFIVWKENQDPYYAFYKRNPHFVFAGLCESWDISEGKQMHSFTILQYAVKGPLKTYSELMPVAISSKDSKHWLNDDDSTIADSVNYMIQEEELVINPIDKAVIDVKNDYPSLIKSGNATEMGENFSLF